MVDENMNIEEAVIEEPKETKAEEETVAKEPATIAVEAEEPATVAPVSEEAVAAPSQKPATASFPRRPRGNEPGKPEGRKENRDRRRGNDREKDKEFEERVVIINRVTKVVKGGRRFRFSALVVVGDKKGRVGMGTGKANEVPDAIKKAIENAKKNLFRVPIVGTTLPHAVNGRYGAGQVFLKPASEGTGVIAGGPVRSVLELAGVQDVLSKCIGSRTPINVVRATVVGLKSLRTLDTIATLREMKPEEVRK